MLRSRLLKPILHYLYRPLVKLYLSKTRRYKYDGLDMIVPKGVFHPGLFFSTKFMASHLMTLQVAGKKVLELGAGTGMLSMLMARRHAFVTATDINPIAVKVVRDNARNNNLDIEILAGSMFNPVHGRKFDMIVINPPYYPKDPRTIGEQAWYCGKDFQYFRSLFAGLGNHIKENGQVFIVLSEDCELESINKIARENGVRFIPVIQKKFLGEYQYIWRLVTFPRNGSMPEEQKRAAEKSA
ncbi:MAG: methyltransferase [Calditrichaeota bacterium]|nr:methyltransferase [Calditrichota bacterium]